MLQGLLVVASQVVTLFLLMAVGFFLAKQKRFTNEGISQMTYLLLYVVTVCVIVSSLQVERSPALMRAVGVAALVMLGLYLLYAVLALPLFPGESSDTRATLRFGVVYGNTGFMGIPLILAILGPDARLFAAVAYAVFSLYSWTHGVLLMGGRAAFSVKSAFLNPGVIGLAVGLPLFLLNLRLPAMAGSSVGYLADLNTPLAMLVIGAQMAQANIAETFRQPRLYLAAAVKLLASPLVTALVLLPLRLPPLLYSTAVILAATPTAGITSMFAQRFGGDTATAARLVTLSTAFSVVTLPVFAVLAQALAS